MTKIANIKENVYKLITTDERDAIALMLSSGSNRRKSRKNLRGIHARSLNIKIYFCNPYHSWEKGGVENGIGLAYKIFSEENEFCLDFEKTNFKN